MNAKLLSLIQAGVEVRFPANVDSHGRYSAIVVRRGNCAMAHGDSPEAALDSAVDQLDIAVEEAAR